MIGKGREEEERIEERGELRRKREGERKPAYTGR